MISFKKNFEDLRISSFQSHSRVRLFATSTDCSTPGSPVHQQLPEITQIHVHWVSDAIQPFSSFVVPFSSCPQSLPASQSFSITQLFATPWTAASQASLSITNSWSVLKPMSIESVMPSNRLILCRLLLLLRSIFPSIRVFSNESALCMRWPKYWSFSFSISPSNEHPGLISF